MMCIRAGKSQTLKSFAPTDKNWSPTCRDLFFSIPPKYL
jgi:hypothetical protein